MKRSEFLRLAGAGLAVAGLPRAAAAPGMLRAGLKLSPKGLLPPNPVRAHRRA